MVVSSTMLFILSVCGATDIVLYHMLCHSLRHHPPARAELFVHFLRGPTYATLLILLPNFELHGAFFWALFWFFGFDLLLSVVDFSLERKSRELLGGLSTGEYLLHVLIGIAFGGLVVASYFEGRAWGDLPSAIVYAPSEVPTWMKVTMAAMAPVALGSGIADLWAVHRLGTRVRSA